MVVACSALKRSYRDVLRGGDPRLRFVHLTGVRELVAERQKARKGHFMPPGLMESQFATLEPLGDDDLAAAMEAAAHERGLSLGPDVPAYLLRHTRRDMASLKTIIDSLDRLSLEQKRPVTLALLRSLLRSGAGESRPEDPDAGAGTAPGRPSALPDRMA